MAGFSNTQFNFTANADSLFKELKQINNKFDQTGKSVKNTMGNISGLLAGAGAGLFGQKILSNIQNFQQQMNNVAAVTQATGQQMMSLENIAREMGESTRFSATEAASGLQLLTMAGFNVTDAMQALPGVLELATAGALDLAQASDIATNVLAGFGLAVAELSRVNDVLAKTATSSNTNIEQLGGALKFVAPAAAGLGVSLEEVNAILGTFANRGIRSFLAGTNLRAILTKLVAPTEKAQKVLKAHNITVNESVIRNQGLIATLGELAAAGLDGADIIAIFGTEIQSAARIMLESTDDMAEFVTMLENSEGAAAQMAEIMNRGLPGSMKKLQSALDELIISLGDGGFIDLVIEVIDYLKETANWFSNLDPVIKNTVLAIISLTAAIVPLVSVIGILVAVTNPWIAILVGLGIAAGGVAIGFATMSDELDFALKKSQIAFDKIAIGASKYSREVPALIDRLKTLDEKESLTATQQLARYNILQDLIRINPALIGAYDEQVKSIGDLIEKADELARVELWNQAGAHIKNMKSIQKSYKDIVTQVNRLKREQKDFKLIPDQEFTTDAEEFLGNIISDMFGSADAELENGFKDIADKIEELTKEKMLLAVDLEKGGFFKEGKLVPINPPGFVKQGAEQQEYDRLIQQYEMLKKLAEAITKERVVASGVDDEAIKKTKDKADADFKLFQIWLVNFKQQMDLLKQLASTYSNLYSKFQGQDQKTNTLDALEGFKSQATDIDKVASRMSNLRSRISEVYDVREKLKKQATETEAQDEVKKEQLLQLNALYDNLVSNLAKLNDQYTLLSENEKLKIQQDAELLEQQQLYASGIEAITNAMYGFIAISAQLDKVRANSASGLKEIQRAEERAAQARRALLKQTIAGLLAESVAHVIAKTFALTGPLGLALAGAAGAAASLIFNAAIPSFAQGGVVSGPTLAMVGDAPGINNPEYISPRKDMIADIQRAVNGGAGAQNLQFVIRGQDLVSVIDNEHEYRDVI